MTPEEKQEILDICNSEEFASKTPIEIVPILADRGIYVASESTFYKVLKEAKQLAGIQYVTPEERHTGKDKEVLEQRKRVCEETKKKHPERWARETRDWSFSEEEWLNPRQEKETKIEAKAS